MKIMGLVDSTNPKTMAENIKALETMVASIGSGLPEVDAEDEGKVLTVDSEGKWVPDDLPTVDFTNPTTEYDILTTSTGGYDASVSITRGSVTVNYVYNQPITNPFLGIYLLYNDSSSKWELYSGMVSKVGNTLYRPGELIDTWGYDVSKDFSVLSTC